MRVGRATGSDWLRLGEAAAELGVGLSTLRRWSDSGKLTCYRSPGGHRRYRRVDVEALLRPADGSDTRPAQPRPAVLPPGELANLELCLLSVARVAAEGAGVARCRVSLVERPDPVRILVARAHTTGEEGFSKETVSAPLPTVRHVLETGRRLLIADLQSTTLLDRADTELLRRRGDAAVLAVPLTGDGHHIGVLELIAASAPRTFSDANVTFAEFMARHIARLLAIDDAATDHDHLGSALPEGMAAAGSRPSPPTWEPPASLGSPAATAAPALAGKHDESVPPGEAQPHRPVDGCEPDDSAIDTDGLLLTALTALRDVPDWDVYNIYRVAAGVARPYPEGDAGGRPLDGGSAWRLADCECTARLTDDALPLVISLDTDEALPSDVIARFLHARGLRTVVLAPLISAGRLVGVVEFGSAGRTHVASVLPLAQAVSGALAVALGGDESISRLRRRNRDLALVIEAGIEDTARLTTDEVLHAVVERLSTLTRTPAAEIYAAEGDTLRSLVSYDRGRFDAEWTDVVLPLHRYPCSRRAVETGEPAIVSSLDDPALGSEGRYSLEKWGFQSQLAMPLIAHGRILGVVELSDYRPRDFSDDLGLVHGLGQVAAHALENAALFEQVDRRNRILNELVELGSLVNRARDLDDLSRAVAERVLGAIDAANCDIYRVIDDALVCLASFDRSGHDESVLGTTFDAERYPTTVAAMSAHQILSISSPDDPQLTEAERLTYHEYGFSSEVCLPLVVHDELYGLLDVYDTRERDFSEHLSFLRSAAQAVAAAFQNALLMEKAEARGAILREIIDLGAMATRPNDLETVLTALAVRLREMTGAAGCDLFALQGDTWRCLARADRGGPDADAVGRVLDMRLAPVLARVVRGGQVVTIARPDDPRLNEEERADMAEQGHQSEVCIPLADGDQTTGLLRVFDTRPRDYDDCLDVARSIARTAAAAIDNAALIGRLERHNATLMELVELGETASSAGDLRALVRSIGPRVVDLMRADGCQIFIVRHDVLHCVLTYDDGEFLDDYADQPLELSLFPSTRISIDQRETLVIESPEDPRLSDFERKLYVDSGAQSEICVPLVLEDRVIGLLDVYDHRRRDYAEHRDFLLRVGQMMAGAFENALLLERLEQSNRTLGLPVDRGMESGATPAGPSQPGDPTEPGSPAPGH